jgi:hypothetical protein
LCGMLCLLAPGLAAAAAKPGVMQGLIRLGGSGWDTVLV